MVDPEDPERIRAVDDGGQGERERSEEIDQQAQSGNENLFSVKGEGAETSLHVDDDVEQEQGSFHYSLQNPPMTRRERFRDWVLRLCDGPEFQVMGMIVLFLVVADGALFFFFLMGWQTLCDDPSRTDCEPRNSVYNVSVQILTGLFTYMVTVSMPWRCANAIHIFGLGVRDNSIGLDLYGRPTNEIWFHIGFWNRAGIIICLLLNCFLQYANQVTRIMYHSYELQNTHPGNKWVNIFFITSFVFAGIGAAWGAIVEQRIRRERPGRFGPGLLEVMREYRLIVLNWLCPCCKYEAEEPALTDLEAQQKELEEKEDKEDPTKNSINLFKIQRAGLRLFGL